MNSQWQPVLRLTPWAPPQAQYIRYGSEWRSWPIGSMGRAWYLPTLIVNKNQLLGGGNSKIFYVHPYLGKSSNLTSIFFKLIETTSQKISRENIEKILIDLLGRCVKNTRRIPFNTWECNHSSVWCNHSSFSSPWHLQNICIFI